MLHRNKVLELVVIFNFFIALSVIKIVTILEHGRAAAAAVAAAAAAAQLGVAPATAAAAEYWWLQRHRFSCADDRFWVSADDHHRAGWKCTLGPHQRHRFEVEPTSITLLLHFLPPLHPLAPVRSRERLVRPVDALIEAPAVALPRQVPRRRPHSKRQRPHEIRGRRRGRRGRG